MNESEKSRKANLVRFVPGGVLLVLFLGGVLVWLQYEQHTSKAYKFAEQHLKNEYQHSGDMEIIFYMGSAMNYHISNGKHTHCKKYSFLIRRPEGISRKYIYIRRLDKKEWKVFALSGNWNLMRSCMIRS